MCILPYHEFSCKKVIRHFWRHSALVAELGCPHQGGSHPERPVWLHLTNFAVGDYLLAQPQEFVTVVELPEALGPPGRGFTANVTTFAQKQMWLRCLWVFI